MADARMQTGIPGLLVAGEAVGGANGANRLSGNAVTEALVFGSRAGRSAAEHAKRMGTQPGYTHAASSLTLISAQSSGRHLNPAQMVQTLQATMEDDVGALRTGPKLERALGRIDQMTRDLGDHPPGDGKAFDMQRLDWLDLRNMLLVARTIAAAALRRTESRGAHQREDFPGMVTGWGCNQAVRLRNGDVELSGSVAAAEITAQ